MTIKFEILANNPLEFFQQLEELLAGRGIYTPGINLREAPTPSIFESDGAEIEARERARINELQQQINAAPAVKPSDLPPETKERIPGNTKKKTTKKAAAKVKPLPEDDDPLATTEVEPDDEEEEEDGISPEGTNSEEDFDPPPVDEQLIAAATDKLRDLFKTNAKGVAGVRALREKYKVTYFHQVPVGQASDLWADALKLEQELVSA